MTNEIGESIILIHSRVIAPIYKNSEFFKQKEVVVMSKQLQRFLSFLCIFAMLFTSMPVSVIAESISEASAVEDVADWGTVDESPSVDPPQEQQVDVYVPEVITPPVTQPETPVVQAVTPAQADAPVQAETPV